MIVVEGTLYPLLTRLKMTGTLLSLGRVTARSATQILRTDTSWCNILTELEVSWAELVEAIQQLKVNDEGKRIKDKVKRIKDKVGVALAANCHESRKKLKSKKLR